ncbi:sugar-binding transcriptional regulator [Lutispora thermophila]|uniref:Central glycolytic genes regulator n=1 Tax=Lutispora thermophila DSM 19022 TaxID=1122184 RepID=A0A1M6H8L9_9FIRM|nr:sugar-binding domain-containing protein [Lutispora thermophila]SHJ18554.1 central glycolytic genes regulator [Lutispora thermophila DSM 19022]
MNYFIEIQKIIAPEISEIIEKRYSILLTIKYNQPVGRRNIAYLLDETERWVRSELDILKKQNLIKVEPQGMSVTKEGEEILNQISVYMEELKGLNMLSRELETMLGVKKVIIVPGDCEKKPEVLKEMGRKAFEYIKGYIRDNSIIAVTGGTSTMAVAENAKDLDKKEVVVVPAIGGNNGSHATQANAVAEKLAAKINASYYPLYLPQNINEEMLKTMLADPNISKVVDLIDRADIFIFGLSTFEQIAKKRKLDDEMKNNLKRKGAFAEAFGYYFNKKGEVIHKSGSIGIKIEGYGNISTVVCIAGGLIKAEAIISINKGKEKNILVIDEKVGEQIYNIGRSMNNGY